MATLDKIPTNDTTLPVRLILCFDGTGDEAKGKDSIHTISRMCKKGRVRDSQGNEFFQVVKYIEGPATDSKDKPFVGNWVKNMIDSATGWECQEILIAGYEFCCENLRQGEIDEIFIFGFSRGAFISRALASFLQYVGLLKPDFWEVHKEEKYSKLLREYAWRSAKPKPQGLPEFCNPSPRVRFLGAFDTVKAIHRLPIPRFLRRLVDFKMDAPHIVGRFRHALALNESRPLFNPDLWGSKRISESNTFEEAWFFGHHHDVGGGGDHQGLALWPLQWIIGAAKDHGLVLHSDVDHHEVLFPGSPIPVKTKDQIAMKMFDMIHRHKETRYNPRLNKPDNIFKLIPLKLIPRNYRQYFKKTSDPLDSNIYLHPSAYLIFDVSASFRLQIHEWLYFHDYMKDRYSSLKELEKPWWEEQTVKSIVKARSAAQHLNILIYGDIGDAEYALLATSFGKEVEMPPENGPPPSSSINTPMKIDNNQVCIYRADGSEELEQIQSFLELHSKDDEDKLHAIWFFLDCKNKEIDDKQKKFLALKFNGVPIHIVVVNHDNSWSNYLTATPLKFFNAVQSRILPFGHIETPADRKINEVKAVIEDLEHRVDTISVPVKSYVRGDGNQVATIKALYKETSICLEKDARLAQIKAQRASVKPSIALANEETVRAYTIWYRNKFHKEQTEFRRNKDENIKNLSLKLLEPVLATFNSRFEGDDEVVRKSLGDTWDDLDDYRPDLFDTAIPGHLILRCMVDATIVMIHACYFQSIPEGEANTDIARPFEPRDVEAACVWYRKTRQKEVHNGITSLLSGEDYSPKGNSISDFQMEFFKMVEVEKAVIKAKEDAAKWFWQRWLGV